MRNLGSSLCNFWPPAEHGPHIAASWGLFGTLKASLNLAVDGTNLEFLSEIYRWTWAKTATALNFAAKSSKQL